MEEAAKLGVKIPDFGGAITDADPRDLPRNKFQQLLNISLERPGDGYSRRGLTFRQTSPFTANLTATKRSHSVFKVGAWNWLVFDVGDATFRAIDSTGAVTTNHTFTPSPAWHTEARMCFAKTSGGELVVTNGIDRPWKYSGQEGTASNSEGPACALGIDPPTAAPSVSASGGLSAVQGKRLFAYRFVDRFGNPSVLSPVFELLANLNATFSWSSVAASSGLDSSGRVVKRELFRTLTDNADLFYKCGEIGDNSTTTFSDTLTEATTVSGGVTTLAQLTARPALPIANRDETLNANRFVVPPSHKKVSVWHEDRLFFMADGIYSTGTITSSSTQATGTITNATNATPIVVTSAGHGLIDGDQITIASVGGNTNANATWTIQYRDRNTFSLFGSAGNSAYTSGGTWTLLDSATVTGSGTAFSSTMVGWEVWPTATGVIPYRIVSVASGTSIKVSPAVGTSFSGAAFTARPARAERNKVYFSEPEEPESVPQSQNEVLIQISQADDDDEIVGGFALPGTLCAVKTRHTYSIDYVRQGKVSVGASPIAQRGAFSELAYDQADGTAYLIDCYGMWSLDGNGASPIGNDFANYWRESLIDFSKSDKFFVRVNRRTNTVRFYVVLSADGSTYPKFCFCFNYALGRWWTESRPWEVSGAGNIKEGNHDIYYELPYGGYPIVYDDGFSSDGITTGVRGTVSSYNGGTLTATTSVFASTMVGYPVVLTSGDGKRQKALITAYTNGTVVTVGTGIASPTTPVSGDKFSIGGIPWNVISAQYDIPPVAGREKIEAAVCYQPTTNDNNTLDIRHYVDYRSTPENAAVSKPEDGEYAELVLGSPDAVVNMYGLKNGDVSQSGTMRKELSGDSYSSAPTPRLLTIEVRGVAVEERIRLPQIDVPGVR